MHLRSRGRKRRQPERKGKGAVGQVDECAFVAGLEKAVWRGRGQTLVTLTSLPLPSPWPSSTSTSPPGLSLPNSSVIITLLSRASCWPGPLICPEPKPLLSPFNAKSESSLHVAIPDLPLALPYPPSPLLAHDFPTCGAAWQVFSQSLDAQGLSDLSAWGCVGSLPGLLLFLPSLYLFILEDSLKTPFRSGLCPMASSDLFFYLCLFAFVSSIEEYHPTLENI